MLATKYRIPRYFFKGGLRRTRNNGLYISIALAYGEGDTSRASVIVSKKVFRSAVARHRIKRRMYDILKEFLFETHGRRPIFIYCYPTARSIGASTQELKQECGALILLAKRALTSSVL